MAAKQGLTAQVYQASEDARRAVLSRAPTSVRSHSWLSNLNTTCTIKSAPPRTPEVMSMLGTKCGWLIKRNEQNVWQRRWCCVVPHSFLYYFEAEPIEAAAAAAAAAGIEFPLSPIGEGGEFANNGKLDSSFQSSKHGKNGTKENYTNIQPVGIIDLECYTTVDRNRDDLVLELTGDSVTNPDLRSFFFQGETPEDCEQWTKAFLNDRHSALKDEREAYKQICENFPLQLMHCSEMMDAAEEKQKIAEKKAYHIRSAAEDSRKKVIHMVRDALEQDRGEDGINEYYRDDGELDMNERRVIFMKKLDSLGAQAVSMNAGVSESVEILGQYTEMLRQERAEFGRDLRDMHERVKNLGHSMISRTEMEETQTRLERAMKTNQVDRARMTERIANLEKMLKKERQERVDAERTLEAKNMEFTMLSAASKQKIQELSGHKKILKKEVIELRKKVEDISSDATVYKHKTDGLDTQVKAEQERNRVLERHLHHVTEQIKMQERVMDCMMSQSGSVYGDSRVGDMHSIGGNSSYRGDTGSRTGRYPPLRSDNSKRNGYSSELPRYPAASPRNVPAEITSQPPAIPKNMSAPDEFNKSLLPESEQDDKKSEIYESTSRDQSSCASRDIVAEHASDLASEVDNHDDVDSDHDDDEESRGNMSELTEDRTFRSDTVLGISPNKQRQPQSPVKIPKSLMEENYDHDDPITTKKSQENQNGIGLPVDILRNAPARNRRPERDLVPRPPLSVEKNGLRNNRVSSPYQSSSQRVISNIPIVDRQFTNVANSGHNQLLSNDNGSIAMSSIHSGASATSNGTGKLSIAQRARLEADATSRAKVVKAPKHILDSMNIEANFSTASTTSSHDPTSPSGGSVWSRLGAKIVDTIDNSAFAVGVDGQSRTENNDCDSSSEEISSSESSSEERSSANQKTSFSTKSKSTKFKSTIEYNQTTSSTTTTATTASTSTLNKNLSLAERQQIQREKQLAFLKHQGLLRED